MAVVSVAHRSLGLRAAACTEPPPPERIGAANRTALARSSLAAVRVAAERLREVRWDERSVEESSGSAEARREERACWHARPGSGPAKRQAKKREASPPRGECAEPERASSDEQSRCADEERRDVRDSAAAARRSALTAEDTERRSTLDARRSTLDIIQRSCRDPGPQEALQPFGTPPTDSMRLPCPPFRLAGVVIVTIRIAASHPTHTAPGPPDARRSGHGATVCRYRSDDKTIPQIVPDPAGKLG